MAWRWQTLADPRRPSQTLADPRRPSQSLADTRRPSPSCTHALRWCWCPPPGACDSSRDLRHRGASHHEAHWARQHTSHVSSQKAKAKAHAHLIPSLCIALSRALCPASPRLASPRLASPCLASRRLAAPASFSLRGESELSLRTPHQLALSTQPSRQRGRATSAFSTAQRQR